MYKTVFLLYACVINVLSVGLDNPRYIEFTVFDNELYENALDPELCEHQLEHVSPFELYDASFRVPQSILEGNTVSMGNYHQCLGIKQDVEGSVVEGKYCMVVANLRESMKFPILGGKTWLDQVEWMQLNLNSTKKSLRDHRNTLTIGSELEHQRERSQEIGILSNFDFSLALCIPKTCTVENALGPAVDTVVDYWTEFCRLPGDKPMVAADYTAIGIFSVIGVLVILSTAFDLRHRLWLKKDPAEASELLGCWSVYSNTKTLISLGSNPGAIHCIDGIRSLSIIWIIFGHVVTDSLNKYTLNILDIIDWGGLRRNIWIIAGSLAVDTFFSLSGLLLVYTTIKKMTQLQLLKNLHVFYLNRLLRMFPLLACAVLLQASLFHHVADGVDWHYMASQVQLCREYWWSTLLHIQNITNPLDYCLFHTWYLSVDVQLHILSPLILFWVLGSRRVAWSGLALGAAALVTATTVYNFVKNPDDGYIYDVYYYRNPLTRCPPFLMGMITGYILSIFRKNKVKVSYWIIGLGYIVSLAVALYCVYSFYQGFDKSDLLMTLHRSFLRGFWGLSVCWIIFACDQGYGGPINWFLSLSIWKFTARISYAMYLFHYPIIWAIFGSFVTPFYFTVGNMFLLFASVMVYTVITSVAACILIDGPCSTLQKMLLKALALSSRGSKSTTLNTAPTSREEKGSGDSPTWKSEIKVFYL